jgi:hydroxyacylglutathione hydrolase
VFPTHGFGSFCSAGPSGGQSSTIGGEKVANPVLTLSEREYLDGLLAGLDAWPAYYAHMGPANLAGPPGPDLSPPHQASAAEVRHRAEAGEWVIDLRDRIAFAAGFLPGSVSFPMEGSFASYLGWTVPWGAPLTLLGETPEQVAQAQRELARIWADRPAAAASGGPARWAAGAPLASLRLAKFGDLAAAMTAGRPVVLDVRRRLEWAESHVAGARHIPLFELSSRAGELPPGEVWVHCHGGYRAIVAASLLAARGRQVVSVDDDFANAAAAGLPLQPA